MRSNDNDEDEERLRLARERAAQTLQDRLVGSPPRMTKSGFPDKRRKRATGRVVPLGVRVHPRVKALWDKLIDRDGLPSGVVFAEILLKTYQEVNGFIPKSELPSDEELVQNLETERDKSDAE
jgi:hypothetical protein